MKIEIEEIVNGNETVYSIALGWEEIEKKQEGKDINLSKTILPSLRALNIWEDYPDKLNPKKLYGEIYLSQLVESAKYARISPIELLDYLVRYSHQDGERRSIWKGDIVIDRKTEKKEEKE